jgi:hypothetical protein
VNEQVKIVLTSEIHFLLDLNEALSNRKGANKMIPNKFVWSMRKCPKCEEVYKIGTIHQCKPLYCSVKGCGKKAVIWVDDDSFNFCDEHAKNVKIENCRIQSGSSIYKGTTEAKKE